MGVVTGNGRGQKIFARTNAHLLLSTPIHKIPGSPLGKGLGLLLQVRSWIAEAGGCGLEVGCKFKKEHCIFMVYISPWYSGFQNLRELERSMDTKMKLLL